METDELYFYKSLQLSFKLKSKNFKVKTNKLSFCPDMGTETVKLTVLALGNAAPLTLKLRGELTKS